MNDPDWRDSIHEDQRDAADVTISLVAVAVVLACLWLTWRALCWLLEVVL